jgi:hypothetical protein
MPNAEILHEETFVKMKRFTFQLLVSVLALIICVTSALAYRRANRHPSRPPASRKKGVVKRYFPADMFPIVGNVFVSRETFTRYSEHLSAMNEPSLLDSMGKDIESYRLLWLRTFDHPVAVRVWRSGNEQFLTVKKLSGEGGYEPGKLVLNKSRRLTQVEWDTFKQMVDKAQFWSLPSVDEKEEPPQDTTHWVLEGVKEGRYHVVTRLTEKPADYHASCIYLLKLYARNLDGLALPIDLKRKTRTNVEALHSNRD